MFVYSLAQFLTKQKAPALTKRQTKTQENKKTKRGGEKRKKVPRKKERITLQSCTIMMTKTY